MGSASGAAASDTPTSEPDSSRSASQEAENPVVPHDGPLVAARGGREILRLPLATRGNDIGFVTLMRPVGRT